MNKTSRHHNILSCIYMACFVFLFGSTSIFAAQIPQTAGQKEEQTPVEIKGSASTFEYQIEGRPDPFMPFITERATNNEDPNEILDDDRELSGMQLFEPGQLTLVALVSSGDAKYAMVQDFTGKGYVIKEGTKIGRRGVVADIVDNKVLIEEKAITRGGKTLINKIAMVLKKEGEE